MGEKKITEEMIERYLYGYKEMRLISSDELFNILQNGKFNNVTMYGNSFVIS